MYLACRLIFKPVRFKKKKQTLRQKWTRQLPLLPLLHDSPADAAAAVWDLLKHKPTDNPASQ